jgi:hypothetical protein
MLCKTCHVRHEALLVRMGVKDPRLRPIAVGRDRPRSTIHTVEVDVSAFRRRAVRSISSVWMVSCTAELFLGAPFPARPGVPRARVGRSGAAPAPWTSRACRWPGWLHPRITWLLGRPSPMRRHARPRRARSCRMPRDWLWSRPHPRSHTCSRSAKPGHNAHIWTLRPCYGDQRAPASPSPSCGTKWPAYSGEATHVLAVSGSCGLLHMCEQVLGERP